ncbi:MAG: translocation/assembly module TamB domain-containing protein [Aquificaceae bacterium]|uniref:translocation/assembly module TamB domain-containing protein n=1 Tax=Hydrogenobacter sp. Uz 6-8 TaxID=3384828 RepID=UPI0030B11CCD
MRVVGYLILLLLALYFLLIKPYLVARNIEIELEGVSLSFEEGLSFKSLLIHLPLKHRTIHLFVSGASIRPWSLQAGEFSLIEVSTAPPSDKPFDYDFGPLTELAGRLNLKVDSLYISVNYVLHGESLTLFIPETELRAGKVISTGWTQVYWMHHSDRHDLEVFLHKARTEGSRFILEDAQVRSGLYSFNLRGIWKGREGSFMGEGLIKPIEGKNFLLGRTDIRFSGNISYTSLSADFSGIAERLDIKGRREFRGLRLKGQYLWKWKEKSNLKTVVTDGLTTANVDYSLKDRVLRGEFRGFPVDSKLLGISQRLSALVSGQIDLDLKGELLRLQAYSPIAQVEGQEISGVSLKMDMSYRKEPEGNIDLLVAQPFFLSVKGALSGKDFAGNISLLGYRLTHQDVSATISYSGTLRIQQGQLFSYGRGKLENPIFRDVRPGSADYDLYLEGDGYRVNLTGRGYSLAGGGSLKDRDFSGRLNLENMSLSYEGIQMDSLRGSVKLNLRGEKVLAEGRIEGNISRESLASWTALSFQMEKNGEDLEGNFKGELKDTRILQFSSERGSFEGKVSGGKVYLTFDLQERLRGKGHYDYKKASYSFEGFLKHLQGELAIASNYRLSGKEKDLTLELSGEGKYREISFPLIVNLHMKGERLEGFLRGFTLREGLIGIKVPDIKVYGNREHGNVDAAPLLISIGQEAVSRVEFQRGEYRGRRLLLKGSIYGVLKGRFEFSYDEGPKFFSEGELDLGSLFSIIRSRVLADAEGKVAYTLSYTDTLNFKATSSAITLRSRYLAVPLSGGLDLGFTKDRLSGYVKLLGNQKASILASFTGDSRSGQVSFEVSQLPVLYRGETFRTSLFVSGKGKISSDYRSLNIGGDFHTSGVVNLQGLRGRAGGLSEEYRRVRLDISLTSSEPLRVNLPEGFLYTDLSARIKGSLYEPDYVVNAYFKGGALTYFEKEFFVRRGEVTFTNKESQMDLTITAPTPDYSIIIDLKGNPQYPKAIVRSEPPRDTREVLTTLVLGGAETEGLIPVGGALISQIPQISGLIKDARGMTGLDIKVQVSPTVSPTGEVGVNATVSKDLSQRISVEHRQSTLRNPRETYTGGDVKLTPNTSIGGRLYSDRSQEVRVRIRKKFDF